MTHPALATKPLTFTYLRHEGQSYLAIQIENPTTEEGVLADFHRYVITEEVFSIAELETIVQCAKDQGESAAIVEWCEVVLQARRKMINTVGKLCDPLGMLSF